MPEFPVGVGEMPTSDVVDQRQNEAACVGYYWTVLSSFEVISRSVESSFLP